VPNQLRWVRCAALRARPEILDEWPLALIGNASGQTFAWREVSIRGVFDKTAVLQDSTGV
jgi:hypothetical protein